MVRRILPVYLTIYIIFKIKAVSKEIDFKDVIFSFQLNVSDKMNFSFGHRCQAPILLESLKRN